MFNYGVVMSTSPAFKMSDLSRLSEAKEMIEEAQQLLIVSVLQEHGALTRGEIVWFTGIPRTTVFRRLEELLHITPPQIISYVKRATKEGAAMTFYRLIKQKCEFCGKELSSGEQEKHVDPYGKEVCQNTALYYICNECIRKRTDET
jgi:hypothetical protein